mmetsp:Transcript_29753/g.46467  ORF Transcript_29753/g.46467 Transcript_29753/m.46467 type:complete len:279 (-) Transcript_29753:722-1558(-)
MVVRATKVFVAYYKTNPNNKKQLHHDTVAALLAICNGSFRRAARSSGGSCVRLWGSGWFVRLFGGGTGALSFFVTATTFRGLFLLLLTLFFVLGHFRLRWLFFDLLLCVLCLGLFLLVVTFLLLLHHFRLRWLLFALLLHVLLPLGLLLLITFLLLLHHIRLRWLLFALLLRVLFPLLGLLIFITFLPLLHNFCLCCCWNISFHLGLLLRIFFRDWRLFLLFFFYRFRRLFHRWLILLLCCLIPCLGLCIIGLRCLLWCLLTCSCLFGGKEGLEGPKD